MSIPFINLDAITETRVEFQLGGKVRRLKDIDAITYMRFCNAWYNLNLAIDEKKIDQDQAFKVLSNLITSVCDDITEEEIKSTSLVKLAMLVNLIHQTVTGQEEIKKKALLLMREPQKSLTQ